MADMTEANQYRERFCAWLRDNGLDPSLISEAGVEIGSGPAGPFIRYTTYANDAEGQPLMMEDGVTLVRATRQSPLTVPLPADLGGRP